MLLLGALVSFAFYAATGAPQFKRYGLLTLKWTVITALGFFAVIILELIA